MPPRVLLLQARRRDDAALAEEVESFARRCGLPVDSFQSANLLEAVPTLETARRHDVIMVGGSGDYYVSKRNLPFHAATLDLLADIAQCGHPMYASCFGFQLLVDALDGEIVHDPEHTELGTFPVTLTPAGRDDPLFGSLPATFYAQLGRKDRAARMPEGLDNLASSELCPLQAFRMPNAPVWASQFHPELDRETNLGRLMNYIDGYLQHLSADDVEAAKSKFRDSPEACSLLPRFLDLALGRGALK